MEGFASLPSRRSVSKIDVLVIMGVLSLLIGLALPAIHWQMQKANENLCASRLKSLGAALQGYHTAHGAFPSGISSWAVGPKEQFGKSVVEYIAASNQCDFPGAPQSSGLTAILPYL